MKIREKQRLRRNKKVQKFAEDIITDCVRNGFTMSDMKDLAIVLNGKIDEALIINEEKQLFIFPIVQESLSNNSDTQKQIQQNHQYPLG